MTKISNTKNGRCNYCGKWGHYFYDCKKRKYDKIINKQRKNYRYKKGNYKKKYNEHKKYANYMTKDRYDTTYADAFTEEYNSKENLDINFATINPYNNNINSKEMMCWILDSGASISITNQLNGLKNIQKCREKIYLANNQTILTQFKGDLMGYIDNHKILIKNVYYSPKINKNLLSIGNLTQQGYKVIFNINNNKPHAIIYNQNHQRILTIKSNQTNTFKFWISTQPLNLSKIDNSDNSIEINYTHLKSIDKINLWHRRLAHFNISNIKNKLLKININTKCPMCISSKLKNKPYKSSSSRAKNIFQLIHMDLIGPVQDSIYGNKYILTILDDNSRYGWTLFLKNKSETFNFFYNWFNKIKNQFNTRIQYIRTDNGTEFNNKNFKQFCNDYGIQHQLIVPYNPQQNGRVERFNGTIINSAKTMLNDAQLSPQFWEDAVSTSNYIHNRIPHKGINNRIPYEILTNNKVNYSNIRVFGCKVFYYIPKSFRSKFQNNSSPGIFFRLC